MNWSKQCNKERDKENNSKGYKTLLQTQQFGNVTHQIYVKANVSKLTVMTTPGQALSRL
jgi:hypothetical protein